MRKDSNLVALTIADAAVSILIIAGLLTTRTFRWLRMDPLAGRVGAIVMANCSFGLLRDTGGILLNRVPDQRVFERVGNPVECDDDRVTDLQVASWRRGPWHFGAIVRSPREREGIRL